MVGQFYFRPEDDQWLLIRACGADAFDGAIVQARYLAPYPEADARYGQDPRELANALREHGAPWLIDLGTPALSHRDITRADPWARLRETDFAQLVELPLAAGALEDPGAQDTFVDAALEFQVDAPLRSAPYFEFASEDDPFLPINLAMLRRVVGAAGPAAVGIMQITLDGLNRGLPLRVAARYADTGVHLLLLRVRNLPAESASVRQFGAYLDAVAGYVAREIDIVADQVGRLGPPVVAGGAAGFSGGAQFFRTVPGQVVTLGGGGGGTKLPVELPGRWATATRNALPSDFSCPVDGCRVAAGSRKPNDLREHTLHYLRYLAVLASDVGAITRSLKASGQAGAVAWADELERRARLSA
jgi:hypothetical protein